MSRVPIPIRRRGAVDPSRPRPILMTFGLWDDLWLSLTAALRGMSPVCERRAERGGEDEAEGRVLPRAESREPRASETPVYRVNHVVSESTSVGHTQGWCLPEGSGGGPSDEDHPPSRDGAEDGVGEQDVVAAARWCAGRGGNIFAPYFTRPDLTGGHPPAGSSVGRKKGGIRRPTPRGWKQAGASPGCCALRAVHDGCANRRRRACL